MQHNTVLLKHGLQIPTKHCKSLGKFAQVLLDEYEYVL